MVPIKGSLDDYAAADGKNQNFGVDFTRQKLVQQLVRGRFYLLTLMKKIL